MTDSEGRASVEQATANIAGRGYDRLEIGSSSGSSGGIAARANLPQRAVNGASMLATIPRPPENGERTSRPVHRGVRGDALAQSIEQTTAYRREKFLCAYVVGTLQRAGLTDLRSEPSKYPILVAINLVNCIATAKRTTPKY
jgi:hypothetical protein